MRVERVQVECGDGMCGECVECLRWSYGALSVSAVLLEVDEGLEQTLELAPGNWPVCLGGVRVEISIMVAEKGGGGPRLGLEAVVWGRRAHQHSAAYRPITAAREGSWVTKCCTHTHGQTKYAHDRHMHARGLIPHRRAGGRTDRQTDRQEARTCMEFCVVGMR